MLFHARSRVEIWFRWLLVRAKGSQKFSQDIERLVKIGLPKAENPSLNALIHLLFFCLQAKMEHELPEYLLGTVRIDRIKLESAVHLDQDLESWTLNPKPQLNNHNPLFQQWIRKCLKICTVLPLVWDMLLSIYFSLGERNSSLFSYLLDRNLRFLEPGTCNKGVLITKVICLGISLLLPS